MTKLTNEDIKMMMFIQDATRAAIRDIYDDGKALAIVVAEGEVGKVIGPGGKMINNLKRKLKRDIVVVEWSEELERFISNIFNPIKVNVVIEGDTARIMASAEDRKYVIGRGGNKIKLANILVERNFRKMEIRA
ncbi:MAG: NusA-like transcription termination signal-binding factor [Candidatus Micrarchaeota archaeon]|nr:NusA-like transcription termination signal-binding factor [Candidatus Micrarchaeota archaeon]